jgi:WS/DGAT/MGAT family acyltransferase
MLRRASRVGLGLVSLGRAHIERAPLTSLSGEIGSQRRFDIVRMSLDSVRRLKKRFGCSVNDIVLTVVTGGLRRLLLRRGDNTEDLLLKAMVPVSVRDPSERMTYGNVVTTLPTELPVGDPDPRRRLEFVRSHMKGLKESNEAIGADFWAQMNEYTPPTLLALASRAATMQRVANLVVANVPGPQFPLYLRGGRLIEAFPSIPLRGTTSLSVAVLSYDGKLGFGLTGDYDIVPDLNVFAAGIRESLEELEALAYPGELSATA